MKDTDLKGCIYNHYKNRYCPIFRLGDIVSEAKEKFSAMAVEVKPASTLGHTLPFKSLGSVRLLMFFKDISSAHQGCIYLIKKYRKNSNIVKYYYNLK